MSELVLRSPLKGWAAPLDEVPDPVFAERMMGDGVAIDPLEGRLHAPCDGVVVSLHRARHALTIRADNGAEILLHIGLETVALEGKGFTAHVTDGQRVTAGELLIEFDLDLLAQRAKSLITPVVLTGEGVAITARTEGRRVELGDELVRFELSADVPLVRNALSAGDIAPRQVGDQGDQGARREVLLPLAHGLHARPAARLAKAAAAFAAEIELQLHGRHANARSAVALMSLGAGHGETLTVTARGVDAEAAVEALAGLIADGLGEAPDSAPAPVFAPAAAESAEAGTLRGVTAAPGLAVGTVVRLRPPEVEPDRDGSGVAAETAALAAAIAAVRGRLEAAAARGIAEQAGILDAHLAMLDDPELQAEARVGIDAGRSAGFAWRTAVRGHIEQLKALGPGRMAERAADLTDLERQVLVELCGDCGAAPELSARAIVVAEELLPSELSGLDPGRLAGFVTAGGGPTSHVAIIAVGLGIPALVAAGPAALELPDGTEVILDADRGLVRTAPTPAELAKAEDEMATHLARRDAARAGSEAEARTADGTRIEVFANLASVEEALVARANGAEGCGLLRTEFLFLGREEPPSEDEQHAAYQAIADAMGGRPMVVRTLDIGSDKPAPYLPLPHEENPALGLRGVRVSLWRPDLLRPQIRAILRVKPEGCCRIMLPMVVDAAELAAVRTVLDEERTSLGVGPIELGANIETPAAAIAADLVAAEAEFLSIGSNDLTQYSLAMDRGHPALASRQDALHPAVLRLIAATAKGARARGRWLGLCGGLSSDLAAVPILIGLGVTELSAAPGMVAEVKARVREVDLDACRALAAEAQELPTAAAVRARVAEWLAAHDRVKETVG